MFGSERAAGFRQRLGRSLAEGVGSVREAFSRGDAEQTAFWAHRLRGSLLVFGFAAAAGLGRDLELRGEENRLDGAGELVRRLEEELERAKALLAGASDSQAGASGENPPGEDEGT